MNALKKLREMLDADVYGDKGIGAEKLAEEFAVELKDIIQFGGGYIDSVRVVDRLSCVVFKAKISMQRAVFFYDYERGKLWLNDTLTRGTMSYVYELNSVEPHKKGGEIDYREVDILWIREYCKEEVIDTFYILDWAREV